MSHSELISEMSWIVIRAITRGEKLEDAMHSVFHLVANWIKEKK